MPLLQRCFCLDPYACSLARCRDGATYHSFAGGRRLLPVPNTVLDPLLSPPPGNAARPSVDIQIGPPMTRCFWRLFLSRAVPATPLQLLLLLDQPVLWHPFLLGTMSSLSYRSSILWTLPIFLFDLLLFPVARLTGTTISPWGFVASPYCSGQDRLNPVLYFWHQLSPATDG
jgi:hypothetical protein